MYNYRCEYCEGTVQPKATEEQREDLIQERGHLLYRRFR